MQDISFLRILITFTYWAINNLYQKNMCFSKLKLFFSMRCEEEVFQDIKPKGSKEILESDRVSQ